MRYEPRRHYLPPSVGKPTFGEPWSVAAILCGTESWRFYTRDPAAVSCEDCALHPDFPKEYQEVAMENFRSRAVVGGS